jgi:hypothetical protein
MAKSPIKDPSTLLSRTKKEGFVAKSTVKILLSMLFVPPTTVKKLLSVVKRLLSIVKTPSTLVKTTENGASVG